MTTTHTFQGLNTENKPSSRVLNPPGGSSSNIFGNEETPQRKSSAHNILGSVSQGNSNVSGQGQNAVAGSQQKSRAPRSAYNPITGESYDEPKSNQGSQKSNVNASECSTNKTVIVDVPKNSSLDLVVDQGKSQPAEEKPTEQEKPQPTEQEIPQPTEQEKPQSTAAPVPAQAAQSKKQQQSGFFGEGAAEDVKEHRSTRVSQPPGGRSTKLW